MPYAPGVRDMTADFLMRGYETAAAAKMAGANALASGISSGANAIAGGIAQGGGEWMATREQAKGLDAAMDSLAPNLGVDEEFLNKFYQANLPGKQKMFGQVTSDFLNKHMTPYQEGQLRLGEGRLALDAAELEQRGQQFQPDVIPLKDPITGDVVGHAMTSSRGSAIPISDGKADAGAGSGPLLDPTGKFFFDGNSWKPTPTGKDAKPLDATGAQRLGMWEKSLAEVTSELSDHLDNIGKGDKHFGFLNLGNREDRVKELEATKAGLEAQIGALQRGGKVESAPGPARAPEGKTQEAMGGYLIGRRYAGKKYLGGDPNNPASWE